MTYSPVKPVAPNITTSNRLFFAWIELFELKCLLSQQTQAETNNLRLRKWYVVNKKEIQNDKNIGIGKVRSIHNTRIT